MSDLDAVVVGSGPNGLAAAVTLARAGQSVLVLEANDTLGGGVRSAELTLPGFIHDLCSAVHPLAKASPCFAELPLHDHGLGFLDPPAPLAHPLDDGAAVMLERSVDATAAGLGPDAEGYRRLMAPLVDGADRLQPFLLGYRPIPRRPIFTARFGLKALRSAVGLAKRFEGERARALVAGLAAHSMQDLHRPPTASFGLVLGIFAHAHNWPVVRGGSQRLANALASYFESLGGRVELGHRVRSLDDLPTSRVKILDVTPRQLIRIAGHRLRWRYLRALRRYRYGPGVFKVDWALNGPVPWRAEGCTRAATVHIGGTIDEIAASEAAPWRGEVAERPFVLAAQQSLFDDSRAPAGKHTLWGYCHVPSGSTIDMTDRIEAQIERFAPGFRDLILERSVRRPGDIERENENYVGGDINGGVQDLGQLYTRPVIRWDPYSTPVDGLYLCSSSTPPGGGVHGMCGYWAARSALSGLS